MIIAIDCRVFPGIHEMGVRGSGFDGIPPGSCLYLGVLGLQKLRAVR